MRSHAEWLALLLDREATWRHDKRLSACLRHAKLRHQAAPEQQSPYQVHRQPKKPRTITLEQPEDWLESRNPPAPNVSMTDGYLAAVIVSPEFIPPDIWLGPIVGGEVADADDDSFEGVVRNTLFNRYNEISSTLSGGVKR